MISALSSLSQSFIQQSPTSNRTQYLQEIILSIREVSRTIDTPQASVSYFSNPKQTTSNNTANIVNNIKKKLDTALNNSCCQSIHLNRGFINETTSLLLKCLECTPDVDSKNDSLKKMITRCYTDFFDKLTDREQNLFCDAFFNEYNGEQVISNFFQLRKQSNVFFPKKNQNSLDNWGTGKFYFDTGLNPSKDIELILGN